MSAAAAVLLLAGLATGRVWTSAADIWEWLLTTDGVEPQTVTMVDQGRSFVRVAPLTVFIMTGEKLTQPYVISGATGRGLSITARHHSPARYLVAIFFTAGGATVWDSDPERWLAGCPIWEAKAIAADRWTTLTYDLTKARCWKHEDIVAVFLVPTTTADPRRDVLEASWSRTDYIDIGRIETTEQPK